MKQQSSFTWKLGMFVILGVSLFILTIYFVGKQKNLFGSTFILKSQFKTVSGLKVGNNVRFSGINVGTVDEIVLTSDTSVLVEMIIKKELQQFIKTDAKASIGSDGLMGDKVLTISRGTAGSSSVKDESMIACKDAIEMDDIMTSAKTSVDNVGVITDQLAQFTFKMNNGNGALSRLISDKEFSGSIKSTLTNLETSSNNFAQFTSKLNNGKFSKALDSSMTNIQSATKGLNENMEAAKSNFLLRGYFKKKKKADAKKLENIKNENIKKENIKKTSSVNTKDSIK